jgi:hypothetical protein
VTCPGTKGFAAAQGYGVGLKKAEKLKAAAGGSNAAAEVCGAGSGSQTAGLGFAAVVGEAHFPDMTQISELASLEAFELGAAVAGEVEQQPSRLYRQTACASGTAVSVREPAPAVCADCSLQQAGWDSCSVVV